jgi:uncharacterized membrane protein YqgA involved in biofilm formation
VGNKMNHTIKNIILSLISICCLVIAIHLFLGGVDKAYATDRASKGYIKDKSKVIILVEDSDKVEYLY